MAKTMRDLFPILRTRGEVLEEIRSSETLYSKFCSWAEEIQNSFLDICTGVRGTRLLYDGFFKYIMNPENTPERLNSFLSAVIGQEVHIVKALPTDSTRIADEGSLVIMDIVVEFSDGSLADVEVQRIGYMFPGQRSACYSADLVLRQYQRVRGERKKEFSYKDIKKTYVIVLFKDSPKEVREYRDCYIHYFRQRSDTGLEMDLLQEYTFIALDNFMEIHKNKDDGMALEAWLTFFTEKSPEKIERFLQKYPEFQPLYEDVYTICENVERVMNMFSKELQQLDRNTVSLMVDEMKKQVDAQKEKIHILQETNDILQEQHDSDQELIAKLQAELDALKKK